MTADRDREHDVRHQETSDTAEWRNVEVPQWVPRHAVWRMFVAGLFVMAALSLSTILVWVLVDDQSTSNRDQIEQHACEGLAANRMVVRSVIQRLGELRGIPQAELDAALAVAPPIEC